MGLAAMLFLSPTVKEMDKFDDVALETHRKVLSETKTTLTQQLPQTCSKIILDP